MATLPEIVSSSVTLESDRTGVTTVVAELPNGVRLRLRPADHFSLINELPGVERELSILAHPTSRTELQAREQPRVTPPEVWPSQYSGDFYGVVEAVGVDAIPRADEQFDVLAVGVGSVYLHPSVREYLPESALPLEPGDELYVPASPLVLWECHP